MTYHLELFGFETRRKAVWTICFVVSMCIVFAAIYIFIAFIQHRHRIHHSFPAEQSTHCVRPSRMKLHSTASMILAIIYIMASASGFIFGSHIVTVDSGIHLLYGIVESDSYLLAQFFFHLILIGRLYNPLHRQLYGNTFIPYIFGILLIVLMLSIIGGTTSLAIDPDDSYHIAMISVGVYMSSDIILSTLTTMLFFRPLYLYRNQRALINQDANGNLIDLVRKYGMISSLQLIVTVFVDILNVVDTMLIWDKVIGIGDNGVMEYNDFGNVIQMLDILVLMTCIYVGFVRTEHVVYEYEYESQIESVPRAMPVHLIQRTIYNEHVRRPKKPTRRYTAPTDSKTSALTMDMGHSERSQSLCRSTIQ